MNKVKLQGHLIIACVNFIFAINTIITKSLMPDLILPKGLTLSRVLFATLAFWITSLFVPKEKIEKKDFLTLFICGMTGIAINQGVYIAGLNHTSSVDASILVTATPMFVMVLAFFFLREPITWKKAGGVATGAAGAILLILSGQGASFSSGNVLGDLFVLTSGLSYSVYLVMVKPITQKYSSVTIMKWMFLFSAIVLAPFSYTDLLQAPAYAFPLQTNVIMRILYVLFGATFITYLMIPMALKRIRPTTVSMYNYLQPVVAAIIAGIVGQDVISLQKIGAAMLIFLGVYLVTISKSREQVEAEEKKTQYTDYTK